MVFDVDDCILMPRIASHCLHSKDVLLGGVAPPSSLMILAPSLLMTVTADAFAADDAFTADGTAVGGSPSLVAAELEAADVSCCTGGWLMLAAELEAAEVAADDRCFDRSSRSRYACLCFQRGTAAALAHFGLACS
jgi:hypothetical protein